jgi:hypothetical protein
MGIRVVGAAVALTALAGCTSVKVAQRDGCWVRRTARAGNVTEELGPCVRPAPPWSEDRLTRLVQECVAGEDYRWHGRALAAWNRGERVPARADDDAVLQRCLSEASRATLAHEQKETLEKRLAEVSGDRDALRAVADADRQHLATSHDKLADALGEAAKKPSPPAVATATATSEGRLDSEGAPQATLAALPAPPAAPPITITAQGGTASAPPPAAAAPALAAHPEPACAAPLLRKARSGKAGHLRAPLAPCAPPAAGPAGPAEPVEVTPTASPPATPAPAR